MKNRKEKEEICALSIIQRIKDGQFNPTLLSKETRQECVEVFMGEGYSKAHMAQILKCSEKTIKRDTDDIFLRNSLTPNEGLLKKTVAQLSMAAASAHERLMRLSSKSEASVSERVQAEYLAFKVITEYIGKLQSLGYLPSSPRAIAGDISLHLDSQGERSLDDLKHEIIEVEKVMEECGDVPIEKREQVLHVKQLIAKAEITYQIDKLSSNCKEDKNEEHN